MNLNLTVRILITPKCSHDEKIFHERGKNIFNIIFYNDASRETSCHFKSRSISQTHPRKRNKIK